MNRGNYVRPRAHPSRTLTDVVTVQSTQASGAHLTSVIAGLVSLGILWSSQPASAREVARADTVAATASESRNVRGGARLFEVCSGCHGRDAGGSPDGAVPALAAQHERYLRKQLVDFHEGERLADCCHESDTQPALRKEGSIAKLSLYLSELEPARRAVTGPGHDLARGEALYRAACQACHLETGVGSGEIGVPSLRAQHYPYLLSQITEIGRAHRFNTPADLILLTRDMTPQDIGAIADYLSRLGSAETMLVQTMERHSEPHRAAQVRSDRLLR